MAKILILANNDIGLYKFRKELIQELIKQGNEVYISHPYGEMVQLLTDLGCTYVNTDIDRRGINPLTDVRLLLHYYKIIKNKKPDMVITYTIKPNIYGGFVSRFTKTSYAINITGLGTAFQREGLFKRLIVYLYKISCKKAKVVFFENEENQRIFINSKIVKRENTCLLNGAGVNLDEYKFCEYPDSNENIQFLFIGRIMKEKGLDELLDAAKKIKKEFDNVSFDIVGPLEEDYINIINEFQEKRIINYYGYQTSVKPFIQNTHCFVLPSYHEGMANTLLESGAMGRPIITSDIHGCKEAVIDGETGYLVKARDSDDLYRKMKQFICLKHEEKVGMGIKSFVHIKETFDRKKVVATTLHKL